MKNSKAKAITPIVATILLVVVAVILVTIVLNWGKNFTNSSVSKTDSLVNYNVLNDKQSFMRFKSAQNGMYIFDYYPPSNTDINFKVVGYSLLGYNDYIPLEPEKEITHAGEFMLPLGIINEEKISIALLLEDGSYLTFNNVKNTNRSPAPSQCPTGFVPVPGNYLYGTEGFCVAKYEMKVDENGDGLGDTNASCKNELYLTWQNNINASCKYSVPSRTIVSSAEGYPLTDINQTDSILACESIGGHLITNEEWMTIARNIEVVPSNWSSGAVGQGSLKRGNAGDVVANVSYDGADPESGTGRNQLAMLKLTNGSEVWDLSGNVLDWTDRTTSDFYLDCNKLIGSDFGDCDERKGGFEYNGSFENYSDAFDYVDFTKIGYKELFLLNSDYNKDNGLGYVSFFMDSGPPHAFLRGGDWSAATTAGVLYLYAYSEPSTTNIAFGFRCVVEPT
ncbi:MAG TPA: hypothetical protein PLK55_01295 [archaeon]|nr:hypothetical protein [archaeon]